MKTHEFTLTPNEMIEQPLTPKIKKDRRKKKFAATANRLTSTPLAIKHGTLKSLGTIKDIGEGSSNNEKQYVYSLPTEPELD